MTDTDLVLVSDFVSVAGGAVRDDNPGDIDVVVRAELIGDALTIPADSVLLQLRNLIAERSGIDRHDIPLHIIPEPTGPHSDYIPIADLVLRVKRPEIVEIKSATAPQEEGKSGSWPMKPAVPFYFEHFSPDQMWEAWGHSHAPFAVEPKWNGWRVKLTVDGDGSFRAVTESGKDVSAYFADVVKELNTEGEPVELDGELLMVAKGRVVPRHLMPAVLSGQKIDWAARPRFFDVLSGHGVSDDTPYEERRKVLEKIVPEEFLTPAVVVENKQELEAAYDRLAFLPGSEGIVAKDLRSTISAGPSQSWSKVKRMLEVRARVVSTEQKENGWVYECEWADGKPTGKTMVTRIRAKPGDTVTVICQELVPSGDSLKFQNAVVTEVNEGAPYTLQQAMRVMLEHANAKATRKWFAGGPMPFQGVGTKARIARAILELFPEHALYCEPFVGTLGFFALKPKIGKEVIGDIDRAKIACYRFIQRASDAEIAEVVEEARRTPLTRETQRMLKEQTPRSGREAALFMMVGNRFYRGYESVDWPPNHRRHRLPTGTYLALKRRLRGVEILNADAFDIIRRLRRRKDVLFYLDPPYPTSDVTEAKYKHPFTIGQFARLLELLKTIRGKFILSCEPDDVRKSGVKLPDTWHAFRVIAARLDDSGRGTRPHPELIITNFKPEKGKWLKEVQDKAEQIPHYRELERVVKALTEETDDVLPGDTRSERAEATWEAKWQEYYPTDGHGRFIVQRHIRGLTREEVDNPPEGHSVHYDIRMTAGDGGYLFGFTVFSEEEVDDPWQALKDGKVLRCAPKQPQPIDWLEIGKGEPFVSGPGEVGSTSQKYARFDAVDWGTYSAGTWNRHFVEVVLHGRRGAPLRLAFQRIEPGVWTVKAGGEPVARRESLERIRSRLAQRGHEVFFYRDPLSDDRPVKVSLKSWLAKAVRRWPHLPWKIFLALLPRLRSGAICYKIVGDWIILPVTNRYLDLHGDFVTRSAVQSLVAHQPAGATVRIAHRDGTDIADLVAFVPHGKFVFGIGKFRNTPKARFLKSFLSAHPMGHPKVAPNGWATSIGFWGLRDPNDPSQIVRMVLREVSILPAGMAANPWTTFPIDNIGGGME